MLEAQLAAARREAHELRRVRAAAAARQVSATAVQQRRGGGTAAPRELRHVRAAAAERQIFTAAVVLQRRTRSVPVTLHARKAATRTQGRLYTALSYWGAWGHSVLEGYRSTPPRVECVAVCTF